MSQQDYIRQHSIQTGAPQPNLESLRRTTPVPLPPLSEQRAIAHILGTLDDKIELNRRMNETLEAMARALFKSWFVDFDPVRAKMEGRDTGLPSRLPTSSPRLVDSELGEIPEGWGVRPILALARLMSGGTPKTDRADYWGGPIAWASAKDVSQCPGTFLIDTERTISARGLEESATQIVPAGAVFCRRCPRRHDWPNGSPGPRDGHEPDVLRAGIETHGTPFFLFLPSAPGDRYPGAGSARLCV